MLKLVVAVLSLALWSEAVVVVRLSKDSDVKNKATELKFLKASYRNFIKIQHADAPEKSSMKYSSHFYSGTVRVGAPSEEYKLIFDTGSFYKLISKGFVDSKFFSIALKQSVLLLGDIDLNYYTGAVTYVPLTSPTYWQFQIGASINGVKLCENCQAIIDIGNTLTVVPDFLYNSVMNAVGATFNKNYNTYTVDCNTVDRLPPLQLTIDTTTFTIEPKEYVITYEGVCSTVFESIGTDVWILGGVFIEKYYAVFDLAHNRVGFALAN